MWTFDRSILQYSDEMVYKTMHCSNKKIWQGFETDISLVDNEEFKCA